MLPSLGDKMREVKVKKEELLEILKENRDKHRKVFNEAMTGYRAEAIKQLDINIQKAKTGGKVITFIRLEEPTDQTDDYERAIGMLEMCVDDEINVSSQEYQQYVLDKWNWSDQFNLTNSTYLMK